MISRNKETVYTLSYTRGGEGGTLQVETPATHAGAPSSQVLTRIRLIDPGPSTWSTHPRTGRHVRVGW